MALQEVLVTSHHSHTHKDKHLGIEYNFEPNKQILVPLAAAVHILGVGLPKDAPARHAAWKRHGFTDVEKGEAYLKKFEAKIVDMVPQGEEIEDLKEKHEKTIEEIEAANESKLAAMEEDHRAELQRINKSHAEEVQALKTRIAELEAPAPAAKSHKK